MATASTSNADVVRPIDRSGFDSSKCRVISVEDLPQIVSRELPGEVIVRIDGIIGQELSRMGELRLEMAEARQKLHSGEKELSAHDLYVLQSGEEIHKATSAHFREEKGKLLAELQSRYPDKSRMIERYLTLHPAIVHPAMLGQRIGIDQPIVYKA